MYKILQELLKLLKRFFTLPQHYMEIQHENTILRRDLTNEIEYTRTLEKALEKLGYDLSQIDNFLVSIEKNEFQNDTEDVKNLGENLKELFTHNQFNKKIKISNIEFIECALHELFTKTSKNYPLIKNAIRNTKIKASLKKESKS